MNDQLRDDLPIWKAYERVSQPRWISGVYAMAGNNPPMSKRQRAAREPGPVTITRPGVEAKLNELLAKVRS